MPLSPPQRKETLASRLAVTLREAILSGTLVPGSKINLDRLRETYSVSVSPLREAVSRLVSDGLVEFEDQRGYRVTPVSRDNLEEIHRLRVDLEVLALGYSIDRGSLDWEGQVMGALHRLDRIDRQENRPEALEAWEAAHRTFHLELTGGSGMPHLIRFCATLHNLNDRYRRIFLEKNPGDPHVREEHRAIAEAAVSRRRDDACELLATHIERTGTRLRSRLSSRLPVAD